MKLTNILLLALRATHILGNRTHVNKEDSSSSGPTETINSSVPTTSDVAFPARPGSALDEYFVWALPPSHRLNTVDKNPQERSSSALPGRLPLTHPHSTSIAATADDRDISQTGVFKRLEADDEVAVATATVLSKSDIASLLRIRRGLESDFPPLSATAQLLADPSTFLCNYRLKVETQLSVQPVARAGGYAKLTALEQGGQAQYYLQYSTSAEGDAVPAYFLPDNQFLPSDHPSYLDLPKNPQIGCVVVIGDLGRQSIIVREVKDRAGSDALTMRLLRDARENSAVLHHDVRLSLDAHQYAREGFKSIALLMYKKNAAADELSTSQTNVRAGRWQLHVQRQSMHTPEVEHFLVSEQGEKQDTKLRQIFLRDVRAAIFHKAFEAQAFSPMLHVASMIAKLSSATGTEMMEYELEKGLKKRHEALFLRKAQLDSLTYLSMLQKKEQTDIALQLADIDKKYECLPQINEYLLVLAELKKQMAHSRRPTKSATQLISYSGEYFPGEIFVRDKQTTSVDYARLEAYLLSIYDPQLSTGLNHPEDIVLPEGFDKDGDPQQMKAFFVRHLVDSLVAPTSAQQGAMIYHIGHRAEQVRIQNRVKEGVAEFFDRATQLAQEPITGYTLVQGFFLNRVGDKFGGRCFPLAIAVAAAFNKGDKYLENFIAKVKDAEAFPTTEEAKLLVNSLSLLHTNRVREGRYGIFSPAFINEHAAKAKNIGKIADLVHVLDKAQSSSSFLVLTEAHALGMGVRIEEGSKKFCFYDPNFAVLVFNSLQDFTAVLNYHLHTHLFAQEYDLHHEKLGAEKINTAALGLVQFESGLKVNDLFERRSLTIARDEPVDVFVKVSKEQLSSSEVKSTVLLLEAHERGTYLKDSFNKLLEQVTRDKLIPILENPRQVYSPLLAGIQIHEQQGYLNYRVPLVHFQPKEEKAQVYWAETRDKEFIKSKQFIGKNIEQIAKAYLFEKGQFKQRPTISEKEGINGLNAMGALQALFHKLSANGPEELTAALATDPNSKAPALLRALQAQTYWNWIQIVEGGRQDVTNVVGLLQELVQIGKKSGLDNLPLSSLPPIHAFNQAFNTVMGTSLQIGNVVFDIYEFIQAHSSEQRAVLGTQLGFDLTSFLMNIASSTSGMLGGSATTASAASAIQISRGIGSAFVSNIAGDSAGVLGGATLAEVLGPLTVPVTGLGIGFTALAKNYGQIADEVRAVGHYFQNLAEAYLNAGYTYQLEKKAWIPKAGVVIKAIDLAQNKVEFDSQHIYPSHHGVTGSGKINYFFWAGDFPRMLKDKAQALNIRELALQQAALSYPKAPNGEAVWHYDGLQNVMILPNTPKSYLSYKYESLPGATTMQGRGLDLLRRLEKNEKLDVDFYIFPSEYSIRTIYQEYVRTAVDVFLDEKTWRLQMPNFPQGLDNWMHYDLYARAGSRYVVGLNAGASLTLHTPEAVASNKTDAKTSTATTRWVLDLSMLSDETIKIDENQLKIGGIHTYLRGNGAKDIFLIKKNGEVSKVDFLTRSIQVVEEDGNQWTSVEETLEDHLKRMSDTHQLLSGQYIAINNFQLNGKNLGRAYFDIDQKRTIYIAANVKGQPASSPTLELATVIENSAYFYDIHSNFFACVDVNNGEIKKQYSRAGDFSSGKLVRVWQEGAQIFSAWQHTLRRHGEGQDHIQLIYALSEDHTHERSILTAINGHHKLLDYLDDHQHLAAEGGRYLYALQGHLFLGALGKERGEQRTGEELNTADLMLISGRNKAGKARRYWLRKHDGLIIKPNLPIPLESTPHGRVGREEREHIPADLLLCASFIEKRPTLKNQIDPIGFTTPPTYKEGRIKLSPQEIFYFYSPKEKALYRQVGAGQTEWNSSDAAQRMDIPDLENVLNMNGALLLVTQSGLIKQIGQTGTLQLIGVNRAWLQANSEWHGALQRLVKEEESLRKEPSSLPLTIFGFEDSSGKTLPAWWYHNRLVMGKGDLSTQALQLIGLASDTQALLFDRQSGRLLQQPLLNAEAVGDAFTNLRLKQTTEIPTAALLLDAVSEISLSADRQIRLATREGLALQAPLERLLTSASAFRPTSALDIEGSPRPMLIGVTAQWQTDNQAQLVAAFEELSQRYMHAEAIALATTPIQDQITTPSWYHFASKQIIVAYELTHADRPSLIDVQNDQAIIFNAAKGQLLKVKQRHLLTDTFADVTRSPHLSLSRPMGRPSSHNQLLDIFAQVERHNATVVLQNKDQSDRFATTFIPLIPSADNLILQTGRGENKYVLTQAVWNHYTTMIIDKRHDNSRGQIMLDIANQDQLIVREADHHILVYDPSTQKSLLVRNVLSDSTASGSWLISTDTFKWEVANHPPRLVFKPLYFSAG